MDIQVLWNPLLDIWGIGVHQRVMGDDGKRLTAMAGPGVTDGSGNLEGG